MEEQGEVPNRTRSGLESKVTGLESKVTGLESKVTEAHRI